MDKPHVSILIPTFNRAYLLDYVLTSLTNQTYKNFEVIVVMKPSGDGTENIIKKHQESLKLKMIFQHKGTMVEALNLGFKNCSGDVLCFIDDDAVPALDWVQAIVETYALQNVGGVAGNVIPALLNGKRVIPVKGRPSEIIPDSEPFMATLGMKLWSCPLKGLENNLVYISKAGMVDYNFKMANRAKCQITKSLLGMGANMSVLSKALEDFRFSQSWLLGLSNEQFLGWHLWSNGYRLFFNPKIKVYHIHHGQTLSRDISETRKEMLRWTENNLLFYRLYGIEPELSIMHRVTWLIFDTLFNIKKICVDGKVSDINRIKSKLLSESIGLKWLLSRRIGSDYSPLADLKKLE